MKKRILSGLMAFVMVLSLITIQPAMEVHAIDRNGVEAKLNSLISQYNGRTLTNNQTYLGSQCKGFANWVFLQLFNVYIGPYSNNQNYNIPNANADRVGILNPGELNETSCRQLLEKGVPGDYIQVQRSSARGRGPHSMILVKVKGEGIEVFDANSDGRNTIKYYTITWKNFDTANRAMTLYHARGYDGSQPRPPQPPQDVCHCTENYAGDYTVTTNSQNLNLRSGHGSNFPVLTTIPKGTKVYVSKSDGNWAHVSYNGKSGVCSMQYLTKMSIEKFPIVNLGDSFTAKIRNKDSKKLLTDTSAGKGLEDSNIQLYTEISDQICAQRWKFTRNADDGSYTITSSVHKKVFNLDGNIDKDGTKIHLYDPAVTDKQRWFIHDNKDGTYSLRPKNSKTRVLDLISGSTDDGTFVHLFNSNQTNAQKFYIEKCYEVMNQGDDFWGLILHTNAWKPIMQDDNNNAVIGTEKPENMNRILYHFRRNPDTGYYTIESALNSKYLDLADARDADRTNVWFHPANGSNAQKWCVLMAEDGHRYIRPACSLIRNIDLVDNGITDGTNIQIYERHEVPAQRFTIYAIGQNGKDQTDYKISTDKTEINVNETARISVKDTGYSTNCKIHIVDPNGKETVVDNKCNFTYDFKPASAGKYTVFAEISGPVSSESGSKTNKNVQINVMEKNALKSISINKKPDKTQYYVGEAFEEKGLELLLKYEDNSTKIVKSGYQISGFDSKTEGTKTIKVTYGKFSTEFTVTVKKKPNAKEAQIKIVGASGIVGDTVDVYVEMTNNPGIVGTTILVDYDQTKLQLLKFEDLGVLNDYQTSTLDHKPFMMNWEDPLATVNNTKTGKIAKLQFKILKDLGQSGAQLKLGVNTIYDVNIEDVPYSVEDGVINMRKYLPGDVNEDGKVDSKDSILLRKYNLGASVKINKDAADVNKDGKIDSKDSILLRKYTLGGDVTLK